MLQLLRGAGITGYEANARIHGYEVDLLWRAEGLVVEMDGFDAHSGRVAFERDQLKVATLNSNGMTVMPINGPADSRRSGRSSRPPAANPGQGR